MFQILVIQKVRGDVGVATAMQTLQFETLGQANVASKALQEQAAADYQFDFVKLY